MRKDAHDLEVSGADPAALAAIDDFRLQLLAIGRRAGDIVTAAEAHRDLPLLQAYAATFFLFGQTGPAQAQAETFLARARELRGRCNRRETRYLEATEAWAHGDHETALDHLEALCHEWPRDLIAAKVAEFHYYCAGQEWNAARFLALVEAIAAPNAGDAGFLAMRAFAHELTGARASAQRIAETALAIDPSMAWAHHTLAHVYLLSGDLDTGLRRLTPALAGWRRGGRVIHAHNAWHLALFHWERLDTAAVDELFRQDIWGYAPDLVPEQLDAIALLWRLDLADRPRDDAWAEIAAHVIPRCQECFIPFVNAHFAYALARAGEHDAVAAALASARGFAAAQRGDRGQAWARVGVPLLEACAALGRGDARRCSETLAPILDEVGRVGGSDAQDALFRESYLVALIRAGERGRARSYLQTLRNGRAAPSALESHWRAQIG